MVQFLLDYWPVVYCFCGLIYWIDCVFNRELEAREYPLMGWVWFFGWPMFVFMHIGIWITEKIKGVHNTDEYLIPKKNAKRLLEEYQKYNCLFIYVDFDNTIYDFHKKGYTYEKMIHLLIDAQLFGNKLVIFTANPDSSFVMEYCEKIGLIVSGINSDAMNLGWYSRKPFYSILLDDRAGLISAYEDLKYVIDWCKKQQLAYERTPMDI